MVVKQMLISAGLTASKFSTGVTRTRRWATWMSSANRYLMEAAFKKLSRVFSMMLVELTKKRKLR